MEVFAQSRDGKPPNSVRAEPVEAPQTFARHFDKLSVNGFFVLHISGSWASHSTSSSSKADL